MKRTAFVIHLLVVCALVLAAATTSGRWAGSPALAAPDAPDVSNVLPAPIVVFEGINRLNNPAGDTDIFPLAPAHPNDPLVPGSVPDTTGAPGHTHFLQAVNEMVAIYTKDGGVAPGTPVDMVPFSTFWAGAVSTAGTPCFDGGGLNHHGQPYVIYDHIYRRFVVADVAYTNIDAGPYYICIAVTNTNLAPFVPGAPGNYFNAANWYYYAIPTDAGPGTPRYFPDMPKLGLWPDGYYLSADLYDIENNGLVRTPRGVKVWALHRDDLTNGVVVGYRTVSFYLPQDLFYQHLVPTNLLGTPPGGGTPNYFASIEPGKFYIWKFTVNWLNPSASTFGNTLLPNYSINTDTASLWPDGDYIVPQPGVGGNERVDVHGDRLMSPLQYRIVDGVASLWASHTVAPNDVAGLRWYEIQFAGDGTPAFYQNGTFAPDAYTDFPKYRWMSSLAVDRAGNMAIGYSTSSGDPPLGSLLPPVYPSVNYTARLRNDPASQLNRGERLLQKTGATTIPVYDGAQYDVDFLYDGPWGRQSQMSVDPLDQCVFWYTNMYYAGPNNPRGDSLGQNWRTVIGWFTLPECRGGMTTRVSLRTDNAQGNNNSGLELEMYATAISADGRFVAFSSVATNLVSNDTNGRRDIFVRDRDTDLDGLFDEPGAVKTVRIANIGAADGLQPNLDSWEVSMSSNGRYVAFTSDATNLVLGDNNGARDVFVHDRDTDGDGIFDEAGAVATTRASVVDNTVNNSGNGMSDHPFIAGNGRYVAFRSQAPNLVGGDTNNVADVFVRDRHTSRTYRVSLRAGGLQLTLPSSNPTLSDNGRSVAFVSKDPLLAGIGDPNDDPTTGVANDGSDVYINDWLTAALVVQTVITPVSVATGGGSMGNLQSSTPYISGNGLFVAFASLSSDLLAAGLDTNNLQDIFVYDRSALVPVVSRVSVNFFGGQALNGNSYSPSITADGRYVTFSSDAINLDAFLPDVNNRRDIFLHDRTLDLPGVYPMGLTQRISLDTNRSEPDGSSFAPVIASGGRHVAFVSAATDLVTNDTNNSLDVFAYDGERFLPIFMRIPGNILGHVGEVVSVPINFYRNLQDIDTLIFSIDFDETCLQFDNLPSSVTFSPQLAAFQKNWSYTASDTTGEIDFYIYDQLYNTPIPETAIVTMLFRVKPTCGAAPGSTNSARVGFSATTPPSFASYGLSVRGIAIDGFISIDSGYPGDCNGDGLVDAGDLSGQVLEIFDGDGIDPLATPGGTFLGNPVGCNPNGDDRVDAGDISCSVLIIRGGGTAGCALGTSATFSLYAPSDEMGRLEVPDRMQAVPGSQVTLPISLWTHESHVGSLVFSLDYDQTWLSFDESDANHDDIPDAVVLQLPDGFDGLVSFDATDGDGELDFVVYNFSSPTSEMDDGPLAYVTLDVGNPPGGFLAMVKSSTDPLASFGSLDGLSLQGLMEDGSLIIAAEVFETFLPYLYK